MVFEAKKNNYGFHVDVNQGLINGYNGWKSGAEMSVVGGALQVTITDGQLVFAQQVKVATGTTLTFDAADPTLTRRDLIVWSESGGWEILKGTPADDSTTIAKPVDYNIKDYVVIGMVEVRPTVTEFDSTDIIDYRTYGIESAAGAGEAFMYLGY